MNETVLITGTSSGLGTSMAVEAAQSGYKVFASMRDLAKREHSMMPLVTRASP